LNFGTSHVNKGNILGANIHANSVEKHRIFHSISSFKETVKISEILVFEISEVSSDVLSTVALYLISQSALVTIRIKWCKNLEWISGGKSHSRNSNHSHQEGDKDRAAEDVGAGPFPLDAFFGHLIFLGSSFIAI
jgi:hypothetical protein